MEVVRVENDDIRSQIYRELIYCKKSGAYTSGRCIKRNLPHLNLNVGDRLEPSMELFDISKFEETPTPFNATFWCMTKRDRMLHESPIFSIPGVTIRSYAKDLLHTWDLGPVGLYISEVFWKLLDSNVLLGVNAAPTVEDHRILGLMQIKSEMWRYYASRSSDEDFKRKGSKVGIFNQSESSACEMYISSRQSLSDRLKIPCRSGT